MRQGDIQSLQKGAGGRVLLAFSGEADKVRDGVDKVEELVNRKTGGKYADQVAKGAVAAENALGVPGEAKRAFTASKAARRALKEARTED